VDEPRHAAGEGKSDEPERRTNDQKGKQDDAEDHAGSRVMVHQVVETDSEEEQAPKHRRDEGRRDECPPQDAVLGRLAMSRC
jgi:hypothetical protein